MASNESRALAVRRRGEADPIDDWRQLRAGDECTLSGTVFTVRDATCRRLLEELIAYGALPYELEGQTLFFAGPTPPRCGRAVGSIGPTTAARMDAATIALMGAGIRATIGKGSRGEAVAEACVRFNGVYFGAIGGIAALLARRVTRMEIVAYPDLGTEALYRLDVDQFPVFVALDMRGRDWYREAPLRFLEHVR